MPEFFAGSPAPARRLGILPSAFNPPTIAHLALADSAESAMDLDQVVLALPREFPHKSYSGASLAQRQQMVAAAIEGSPDRAAALTDHGLFFEIAREFRGLYPDAEIFIICGKDAAERIANWNYGEGPSFDEQLGEFGLIVGDRGGRFKPRSQLQGPIIPTPLPEGVSNVSSRELRQRRAQGLEWRSLTTPPVVDRIENWSLYSTE